MSLKNYYVETLFAEICLRNFGNEIFMLFLFGIGQ